MRMRKLKTGFFLQGGPAGGSTQPEEVYKPSEHDGLKKDGTPDKRVNPEHGFGGKQNISLA